MKNLSLGMKFTLLFLAIFFIPFGLLSFFSLSMSKRTIEQNTILHMQNLAEIKETAIEQWLQERIRDGKVLTESQEIKSLDPKKMESFLNFKKNLHPAYRELLVVDLKGKEISNRPLQRIFEKEEWFQKAIAQELFISPPIPSSPSKPPYFIISLLIKDGGGKPAGILKELVEMDYVAELIFEPHLGKTGKLLLANLQGEILLHERWAELNRGGVFRLPYFENFSFQPSYTAIYKNGQGTEVLGSWKWISGLQCFLIAEQDTEEAFHETHLLTRKVLLIFSASTIAILLIAYWAVGSVTGPIKSLSETVASFAEGQFHKVVVMDRRDEIGKLLDGFTKMAARLKKAYGELEGKVEASNTELQNAYYLLKQRQEQLIRSEKMAALGQLSAGVAHEIRNPLTSIKIFIQTLEKEIDLDENRQEDFRIIKKEIDRLNEIVIRFLTFARPEEPQFQWVDLCALLKDNLNLLTPRMEQNGIHLIGSLAPDCPPVKGDPKQLAQVMLNLLLNAIEAMPHGGRLEVQSALQVDPETQEEFLQLAIRDTGPGIKAEDRVYLFDPFFTTKEGGTGLGLAIAYSIVQKHNGRIEVKSEPGQGASFVLSLPLSQEASWKKSSSSTMI